MEQLKSLQIKNFKHIKEHFVGFESIDNLNILIGQNNVGKSTLLQSIELLLNKKIKDQYVTENTVIEFSFCPDENDIRSVFMNNVSGGYIGGNHYEFGKNFIGKSLSYTYQPIPPFGQEQCSLSDIINEVAEKEIGRAHV